MITLTDMNKSWHPPYGFEFTGVEPKGGYLVVRYERRQAGDSIVRGGLQIITIYLQDMGREVLRTTEEFLDPVIVPAAEPKPVATRFRFWNGFLLTLQGLEEMAKCLKLW